jgi:hypothetical protein
VLVASGGGTVDAFALQVDMYRASNGEHSGSQTIPLSTTDGVYVGGAAAVPGGIAVAGNAQRQFEDGVPTHYDAFVAVVRPVPYR